MLKLNQHNLANETTLYLSCFKMTRPLRARCYVVKKAPNGRAWRSYSAERSKTNRMGGTRTRRNPSGPRKAAWKSENQNRCPVFRVFSDIRAAEVAESDGIRSFENKRIAHSVLFLTTVSLANARITQMEQL